MKRQNWIRAAVLAILTLGLAVPPDAWIAWAQQQDNGPIKPPGQQAPPPQAPAQPQKPPAGQAGDQNKPEYQLSITSNLVNVDAVVTDQDGNILTGLKRDNFRVTDNGEPQQITNFAPTDAPITIVMLMEFSSISYWFAYNSKIWSYEFLSHLNKNDWVALITYDLNTHIEVDFTQNKEEVQQSIASLFFPNFHEANTFDAVLETIDRLQDVKGKKSILLLASGFDTFSKHTLDQTYKRLKNTDVTIFCIGVAEEQLVRQLNDGGVGYLQAKNQLSTFSKMTGGFAWFPRFDGELPSIFQSVTAFLRNQYTIGFVPSNITHDGKYHKLKVEVLDDKGNPLVVTDKKGKSRKIVVYAREGYTAISGSVGD
jgi:VWFA-related protein